MRLVTYLDSGAERVGALVRDDEQVVDLAAGLQEIAGETSPYFCSMLSLIESGSEGLSLAQKVISESPASAVRPVKDVKLLAPLTRPPCLRDFVGYGGAHTAKVQKRLESEAKSAAAPPPSDGISPEEKMRLRLSRPRFYTCNTKLISGPDEDIVMPTFTEKFDYEHEVAVVIGRKGKDISKEDAKDYIFGYTIFNDWSARDVQIEHMKTGLGAGKGKEFDGSNTLGPCIVTADEIDDPYNLSLTVRVNGEVWGRGNQGDMYHRFEDIIVEASRCETLLPGELLAGGTMPEGSIPDPSKRLNIGDVVELEVERIGVLRNRIVAS